MFPKDFLWGAGTSSHQVEGNNTNNDWWQWENENEKRHKSGLATRHYEFYESDFDIAKKLNHNAHRFSIEWSRIQPQKNRFDSREVLHYQKVIKALLERNIKPIVTLHHFTNPLWFVNEGGWLSPKSADCFTQYVEFVVNNLGKDVEYWITINEPIILAYYGYTIGDWPPQTRSFSKALVVLDNFVKAHNKAYEVIHSIYEKNNWKKPKVAIAQNMIVFKACQINKRFLNNISTFIIDKLHNFWFLNKIKNHMDFIGVNYYSFNYIEFAGLSRLGLIGTLCGHPDPENKLKRNLLNYFIYPQGIYDVLIRLKKYNLPVLITENGTCVDDDNVRWEFIRDHIKYVEKAISKGVSVIGYLYWSLLDNFEWDKGFSPRFGLVEIDYSTYKRTVRPSGLNYAIVCRDNSLSNIASPL